MCVRCFMLSTSRLEQISGGWVGYHTMIDSIYTFKAVKSLTKLSLFVDSGFVVSKNWCVHTCGRAVHRSIVGPGLCALVGAAYIVVKGACTGLTSLVECVRRVCGSLFVWLLS